MKGIEVVAATCLAHGWPLVLAFTAASLCVALLRRPGRRLFGAERACQLWFLPPLAMLASQWPHATTVAGADEPLPALVYLITSAALPPSPLGGVADSRRLRAQDNPQALSTRLVALDFDQIPAQRAMQLMADIDGKQAIFRGTQVRFDAK